MPGADVSPGQPGKDPGLPEKRDEVKGGGSKFVSLASLLAANLVLGFVFWFFRVPGIVLALLAGAELLSIFADWLIGFKLNKVELARKRLKGSSDDDALGENLRANMVVSGKLKLADASLALFIHAAAAFVIFYFFAFKVSFFVSPYFFVNQALSNIFLKALSLSFVSVKFTEFLLALIKYRLYLAIPKDSSLKTVTGADDIIENKFVFARYIPFMTMALIIIIMLNFSPVISWVMVFMMLLIIAFSFYEIRQITDLPAVVPVSATVTSQKEEIKIDIVPGENIYSAIYGIVPTEGFAKPGEQGSLINTLFISNSRLLFLELPGKEKSSLKSAGDALLATGSMEKVLEKTASQSYFVDIKSLVMREGEIAVEKSNKDRMAFNFSDPVGLEKIERVLKFFLKGKFSKA